MNLKYNKILVTLLYSVLILLLNFSNVSAQQEYYITNGTVYDSLVANNRLYIGGQFSALTPPRGSFALMTTGGIFAQELPKVGGGEIRDIVTDGNSGYYIAGTFTKVGDQNIPYLAHITSNGLDTSWIPTPDAPVNAILNDGTDLYVAGEFTTLSGVSRSRLASYSVATGLINSFAPNVDGPIYTLSSYAGELYIGGLFNNVDSTSRGNLAGFTTSTGVLNSFDVSTNDAVRTLLVNTAGTIYFAGSYTSVVDSVTFYSRHNLASATTAGSGTVTTWDPNPDANITKLASFDGYLYVMGFFSTISSTSRNGVARYDVFTSGLDSWSPQVSSAIYPYTATVIGSNLYLGGDILEVDGSARYNILALDTTTGAETSFAPFFSGTVRSVYFDGGGTGFIAVGGSFGGYETKIDRNNLAALDLTTGQPTSFNPIVASDVNTLLSDGTKLYVAGAFNSVNSTPRLKAAAFNLSDGTLASWNPSADFSVRDLALNGSNILLAGDFTQIGSTARNHIAEVDNNTGALTSLDLNADGTVNSIAINGSELFLGGSFANVSSTARSGLAKVSLPLGSMLSWNPSPNGTVYGLFLDNTTLYVAGGFSNIDSVARARMAALDSTTGTASSWDPGTANPSLQISNANKILASGTNVYVAGGFASSLSDKDYKAFLKLNSSTAVISTFMGSYGTGYGLNSSGGVIYGSGRFFGSYGNPYDNIATIDGALTNITPPTISGTEQDTGLLTNNSVGFWIGVPLIEYQRQWYRCDSAGVSCSIILGEIGETYTLVASDVGNTVQLRVIAKDSLATSPEENVTSGVIDPKNTSLPVISGTATEGSQLSSTTGNWNDVTGLNFNYQWERCNSSGASCANIAGETDATYTLTATDVGSTLRVRISAQRNGSAGNNSVESVQTGVVAANPTPTPTFTQTPVATITSTPSVTPQPTPQCSLPKPSVSVKSGQMVVKYPRTTQLAFCTVSSLKASISFTTGTRTKVITAKFKAVSRRPRAKKVATLKIKPVYKNKRGAVVLKAIDTATSILVSGVVKNVKAK